MFYFISKFIQDIFKINELVKKKNYKINVTILFNILEIVIIIFIIGYNICKRFIIFPSNVLNFFPVLNCIFSFCYFLFIFIYANIEIFKI